MGQDGLIAHTESWLLEGTGDVAQGKSDGLLPLQSL